MTTTTYTLTCLSPVHIGTGTQMSKFDGAYADQTWYVIDLDAVLARGVDANQLARAMSARDFDWAIWLRTNGIASSDVALYAVPCRHNPETVPIREVMKNPVNRPYLPGTSIKGALRTAVLVWLLRQRSFAPGWFEEQLNQARGGRQWLSQPIERAVLGRNPNLDLMRTLQVADTAPIGLEHLAVGLVWTYTLRGSQLVEKRESDGDYKVFVEWLMPGTTLRFTIRLDDFLFSQTANRDLRFRDEQEQAVRHLSQTCNAWANALITREKAFYGSYGPEDLQGFYTDLENTLHSLPQGAFLLNIGWGSGWGLKTIGDVLRTAMGEEGFKQLRQRYRLGTAPRTGQLDLSAPFPKTRRIAYEGGAARWAMGWVKVE